MDTLTIPLVDLNHWLGGPPETPVRFSVVLYKGNWEVWDLYTPDARRFAKFPHKEKHRALALVARWAKMPVTLEESQA